MIAFFNHFKPKRSKSVPMTVRNTSIGTHWTSAVPSVATSRASVAAAPVDRDTDDQDDGKRLHKLNGGSEKRGSSNDPLHKETPCKDLLSLLRWSMDSSRV